MSREVKTGMTDYSVTVFIPDSASTDGSGKTGLVAANLTVSGVRVETDNDVTVTDYTASLNNLAALTTAHTDWGLLEVSSTLAPGLYRLDIADAIFATGAWSAVVYVMVTTSAAAATPMEFILVPQSPIDGVLLAPTTHTSAVIPTVTTLTGHTAQTGDNYARLGAPAGASVSADVAAMKVDTAAILVDTGTTLDARIPAALVGGRMDASVGAMAADVITAAATAVDYLTEIRSSCDAAIDANSDINAIISSLVTIDDFLDTEVAAIKAKTDNLPASPAAVGSAMTLTSAYDFAKGTVAMTEGYAADGSTATPSQMFYMLWSLMAEKSISSTTLTAKKLDGSTSAMTFTLSDATSPVSITRAT